MPFISLYFISSVLLKLQYLDFVDNLLGLLHDDHLSAILWNRNQRILLRLDLVCENHEGSFLRLMLENAFTKALVCKPSGNHEHIAVWWGNQSWIQWLGLPLVCQVNLLVVDHIERFEVDRTKTQNNLFTITQVMVSECVHEQDLVKYLDHLSIKEHVLAVYDDLIVDTGEKAARVFKFDQLYWAPHKQSILVDDQARGLHHQREVWRLASLLRLRTQDVQVRATCAPDWLVLDVVTETKAYLELILYLIQALTYKWGRLTLLEFQLLVLGCAMFFHIWNKVIQGISCDAMLARLDSLLEIRSDRWFVMHHARLLWMLSILLLVVNHLVRQT